MGHESWLCGDTLSQHKKVFSLEVEVIKGLFFAYHRCNRIDSYNSSFFFFKAFVCYLYFIEQHSFI